MKDSVPLNDEQRQFAEENHNLVYAFLHEKELPEDEFYDVVIFGYLQAVYEYTTKPLVQKYSFSTIAWRRMDSRLSNHYRYLSVPKRCAQTVSLYAPADNSGLTWEETIGIMDDCMAEFESELMLHDLAKKLPRPQMNILYMKANGYGVREIAKKQKITIRSVRSILDDAYDVVISVCGG
jgi:DNA-directed RNA polymerase specialized sigma24 family protein